MPRFRPSARALALGVILAPLAACGTTHTKGSWACPSERGVPCAGIADIDGRLRHAGKDADHPPRSADGAGALRWWAPSDLSSGSFDGAPRREPDQVAKVLIAGWIDAGGDYHAPSEVYALMRRGAWWAGPPAAPLVTTMAAKARSEATAAPKAPGPAAASKPAAPAAPGTE